MVFSSFPQGRATLMWTISRGRLNTLFDSHNEQVDRTLTAILFEAEDAQIHRLILENESWQTPLRRESTSRFAGMRVRTPA
jgi:hypothetical protein